MMLNIDKQLLETKKRNNFWEEKSEFHCFCISKTLQTLIFWPLFSCWYWPRYVFWKCQQLSNGQNIKFCEVLLMYKHWNLVFSYKESESEELAFKRKEKNWKGVLWYFWRMHLTLVVALLVLFVMCAEVAEGDTTKTTKLSGTTKGTGASTRDTSSTRKSDSTAVTSVVSKDPISKKQHCISFSSPPLSPFTIFFFKFST